MKRILLCIVTILINSCPQLVPAHQTPNNNKAIDTDTVQTAIQKGHRKKLKTLIQDADANVNIDGTPLLHIAVETNNPEIVQLLLKNNANPNIQDDHGRTALMQATRIQISTNKKGTTTWKGRWQRRKQRKIMESLLTSGANPNKRDKDGMTALHHAVIAGNEKAVQLLLTHKADANITTKEGKTPLDIAKQKGYKQIANTLRTYSTQHDI